MFIFCMWALQKGQSELRSDLVLNSGRGKHANKDNKLTVAFQSIMGISILDHKVSVYNLLALFSSIELTCCVERCKAAG